MTILDNISEQAEQSNNDVLKKCVMLLRAGYRMDAEFETALSVHEKSNQPVEHKNKKAGFQIPGIPAED